MSEAPASSVSSSGGTSQLPTSFRDYLYDEIHRPEWIGRYRVLDLLGVGGMGLVYLAEQRRPIRRKVAIKLIKVGMDTREVIARFEAERQALALMDHPNIAAVHDAGATDRGRPYFVMEYVPGVPITEHCDKNRLSLVERLRLFQQVCEAVQHAHQKGIIHRDLKPLNILVMTDGERPIPKIIDFGIAKATNQRLTEATIYTEQGRIIGTPQYMSPEQARTTSQDVDTRTDIYSLGMTLYELLVGVLPFDEAALREASYVEVQRMILDIEPARPSSRLFGLGKEANLVAWNRRLDARGLARRLRGDLDWIVLSAIDKERNRRYGTAAELAQDIERYLRHEPVRAGPPGIGYRLGKFVRRNRNVVAAALAIFLALTAGLVASLILYGQARRNLEEVLRLTAFSHARQIADATSEAADLWPESSKNAPRLEAWLENAHELREMGDRHRGELERLRIAALPYDDDQRRVDRAGRPQAARLGSLEASLDEARRELASLRSGGYHGSGATVLSYGDDPERRHPTCYFRRTFQVERPEDILSLRLGHRVDDGAVFWLNGKRVHLVNMPSGLVTFATLATRAVWGRGRETPLEVAEIENVLIPGENVLAAEVHQWHAASEDLLFDAELVGLVSTDAEIPLVESGALWEYDDRGQDLGENWAAPGRETGVWRSGSAPLGYGFTSGEGRAAELPVVIERLEAEAAKLRPAFAGRRLWRFEDPALQWRHDTLEGIVRSFESFSLLVRDVEGRLEFARSVRPRTIEAFRSEWEDFRRAIADEGACPWYKGLRIAVHEGLIPLGQDPRSRLFEFAHLRTGVPPRRDPTSGQLEVTEATGLVFVLLPAASFAMGAIPPDADNPEGAPNVDPDARKNEGPVNWVSLEAFFISKYEMTQGQWVRATHGKNPSAYGPDRLLGGRRHTLRHPVENVGWDASSEELAKLGLELPTEAQWEYAARGGERSPWWTGDTKESLKGKVNLADRTCKEGGGLPTWQYEPEFEDGYVVHAPVGSFLPNRFGLHEVAGNVWEWCRDAYGIYEREARPGDGLRRDEGGKGRVFRGGSFQFPAAYCRSACRDTSVAERYREMDVGVRPAMRVLREP